MRPIVVVLLGVTGLLSDIVKKILDEPDIRLRAEYPLDHSAVPKIVAAGADVVIVASDNAGLAPVVRALLGARPRTKVLAIREDGRQTSLYELRAYETELGQVSPELLLEVVRTARTAPL